MNKILKATYPLVAMLGLTAALLTACTGDSDDAAVGANRQVCFVSATRQFDDGNDTTGIDGVQAVDNSSDVIYNLQGQRVENAVKGIYIINGKKVYVK